MNSYGIPTGFAYASLPPNHTPMDVTAKRSSFTGKIKQSVSGQPVKTFEVFKISKDTWNELELQVDGQTMLWSTLKTEVLKAPIITFRAKMQDGPIVAGAKLVLGTADLQIVLGDPNTATDDDFIPVDHEGRFKPKYVFPGVGLGEGRDFQWRRTHQKELGSRMSAKSDFKLIDTRDNEKIVAAYIVDEAAGPDDARAHIDFYVSCDSEFELEALITIFGIEERHRRSAVNSATANMGATMFLGMSGGIGALPQ